MSEEKQIEEMARFMCSNDAGEANCADGSKCDFDCWSYREAEHLYNAGYRKQSEGEWIKHCNTYECSVCKEELFIEYAEDYDAIEDWNFNFCPFCGAKMKGGEEQ